MNQVERRARAFNRAAIGFLIRLSETDPAALLGSERPGDLPNLIADLYRFRLISSVKTEAGVKRLADSVRSNAMLLEPLPALVGKLLTAAADKQHFEWKLQPGTKAIFEGTVEATSPGRMILFTPEGPRDFQQAVVMTAMQFLNRDGGDMVRRCARQACKRIFLASRPKQIFCDRPCASAAAFDRYKLDRGEETYRAEHRKTARTSWRIRQRKQGHTVKPRIKDIVKPSGKRAGSVNDGSL
jgi:hypothetical protein